MSKYIPQETMVVIIYSGTYSSYILWVKEAFVFLINPAMLASYEYTESKSIMILFLNLSWDVCFEL